jgi:nucleoid-associated protein YgaU
LIATVEIHKGSRLTLLAQQYYGHKELWVFIYEANLGRIKSPTNIKEGTQIRIPKLNEQLTDIDNPDTKELIQQLNRQYLR